MNKMQALGKFWNSFDVIAYEENSVPDNAEYPYITYSVATDSLDATVNLQASIYHRSNSWQFVDEKSEEIARALAKFGPYTIKIDEGYIYLTKGTPFSQRMGDPSDDSVKRIYLNLQAEFLTAF